MNALTRLAELEAADAYVDRHVAPGAAETAAMLHKLGLPSLDALAGKVVPESIRLAAPAVLPPPLDEASMLAEMRALAAANAPVKSLIGQGYHGTATPPVIQRNVLENPAWYTAYTPYQPEISQGRLEALLTFQTMICELTAMPVANASLLDEGTAAAEAVSLAHAVARTSANVIAVVADIHPQTRAVIATRAAPLGFELRDSAPGDTGAITEAKPFAVVLQYPGTEGAIRDLRAEIAAAHAAGALAIVATDLLALTLLTPPGEIGADIVIGSAQRFGMPMGFGGPHAAFFATRDTYKRHMPGRIVGVSVDSAGAPALRLALQTREQHIRREKATSNICTAQALPAIVAAFYAMWHGPERLANIAQRVHLQAQLVADAAKRAGFCLRHESFFDTVVLEGARATDTDALMLRALNAGFNLRRLDAQAVAIALDETVTRAELERLSAAIGAPLVSTAGGIPGALRRRSPFLIQPVFADCHAEHAMLRTMRRLADRDIALDRGMIPLGSCTMKLNAAASMMPMAWPGFADVHPFAPPAQTGGYARLLNRLAEMLAAVTGLPAVSLQPNAGSQGEYAGLLAIRAWHAARGEAGRNVVLIPASAHGTNPASAVMAGYRVVVVACREDGEIDFADLQAKLAIHAGLVAALMVTYPSTHGVFEESIRAICDAVHAAGGQIYMDGANLNAQLGLTSPGHIGADVCHLNLHKTFCIPHGGGGPGAGPIAVAEHLRPYLPAARGAGAVASAPFGNALVLTISYAYLRMMGTDGLKHATLLAILNANYIAARLAHHYPILYRGVSGMVAHECILDCRGFAPSGIRVEDIAKRLQDYGFHAPTMSWPVPGTLMIEPTESEPKAELDRFCDAMIAIRAEIEAVATGRSDRRDNPLVNAPHTAREIAAASWTHAYTREDAAFPLPGMEAAKYWPPAKRVDNAYGDRNLVCTCPAPALYAEAAE